MTSSATNTVALIAIALLLTLSLDFCHAAKSKKRIIDALVGENVTLPCKATPPPANSALYLEWNHNSATLKYIVPGLNKSYNDRAVVLPSNDLYIDNINLTDSGIYGCKYAAMSNTFTTLKLNVFPMPSVEVTAAGKIVDGKKQTLATCVVRNATANSRVEWRVTNGDVVKQDAKVEKVLDVGSNPESYTLTTEYKAMPEYTTSSVACFYYHLDYNRLVSDDKAAKFEEKMRTFEDSVYLPVMESTTVPTTTAVQVAPSIKDFEAETVTLKRGESRNFTCKAGGYPVPDVTWLFKSEEKSPGKLETNTFEMTNAQLDDAGEYKCIVQSSIGAAENTFVLKVTALPEVQQREESVHLTADMGSAELQCDVTSNPVADIKWRFEANPKKTIESEDENIGNYRKISTVSIPHTEFSSEQETQVVCIATNDQGVQQKSFTVTKEQRPGLSSAIIAVVVVVLVLFIVVLVVAAVVVRRRAVASVDAGNAESGCAQTLLCVKTPQLENDDKSEPVDDVVKEEDEEEVDEKQHLTEATAENDAEQPQDVAEEEKMLESPKKKLNLTGSLGCCRRSRKKLQEDEDDDDVTGTDNKNGDATANGEGVTSEDAAAKNAALESISEEKKDNDVINDADSDRDSGKGDTLKPMAVANGDEGAVAAAANNTDAGGDVTSAAAEKK